mgnify:FL=1|tara:strand:+ start:2940 stop:3308 length:369 start_codon:yes stop_codon:yes gene_type:complete
MTYQKDVAEFMEAGEQQVSSALKRIEDQEALYMNLITEEYKETLQAFQQRDIIELADGLADMVWVIMGLCNSVGIDFEKVWEEVRSSNMSKFQGGRVIKNDQGKILKPESYFKPDIKKVLGL